MGAKIAVYAGSFDPPTLGHLDIIQRAGEQYDRVVVTVAHNPDKKGLFTPNERSSFLLDALGDENAFVYSGGLSLLGNALHITTKKYVIATLPAKTMLAKWAAELGAIALVRGLRAVSDFDVEFRMALANRRLVPEIETVFLMTAQEHLFISSSTAKEVASIGGDLSTFVTPQVAKALQARLG